MDRGAGAANASTILSPRAGLDEGMSRAATHEVVVSRTAIQHMVAAAPGQ